MAISFFGNAGHPNLTRPDLHVNGITDECSVAEMFAQHFAKVCTSDSKEGAARLTAKYTQMRSEYCGGLPHSLLKTVLLSQQATHFLLA